MRSFEVCLKPGTSNIMYPNAQLPEYQTKYAAGADFFAAEDVDIPSLWRQFGAIMERIMFTNEEESHGNAFKPTLIHTGIKADMEDDEVLYLYNRSSNPKNLGLILANSVGVIDKDYYNNPDNDGEIMFAFYNVKPWTVHIKVGDRIGQGVFQKVLRPEKGLRIKNANRVSGFGSTGL